MTQNEHSSNDTLDNDELLTLAGCNITWNVHSDGPSRYDEDTHRALILQHVRSQAASQLVIARSLNRIADAMERAEQRTW